MIRHIVVLHSSHLLACMLLLQGSDHNCELQNLDMHKHSSTGSCYAMLAQCYAVATLCYAVPCCAVLCCHMLCRVVLCRAVYSVSCMRVAPKVAVRDLHSDSLRVGGVTGG